MAAFARVAKLKVTQSAFSKYHPKIISTTESYGIGFIRLTLDRLKPNIGDSLIDVAVENTASL